jgi:hypothetical protein
MTLRPCSSPSAAAWITSSDLAWHRLVGLGPSGFDAYARLRFLPDPLYNGQPEITLDNPEAPSEHELLHTTLEVLRQHTTTTDEVYFCLWDGWGSDAFPPSVLNGVRVVVPNRAYFMLRGTLSDFGTWHAPETPATQPGFDLPDPAFIWPGDHAWCIANDVDPHYAGIGATSRAVQQLLAHPELDIVSTDPGKEPPYYY